MNHTEPQFSSKMLATVIMKVKYKIFHPTVLHIVPHLLTAKVYKLLKPFNVYNHTYRTKKMEYETNIRVSNILWQKTFPNASMYTEAL